MTESAEHRGTSNLGHSTVFAGHRSPRFRFKAIWIGSDGLRAGWAVSLFFAIAIGLMAAIGFIASRVFHFHPPTSGQITASPMIVMELLSAGSILIATKVMSLFDKKSWLDYGLRAPRRTVHLLQGLLWGVTLMAAMMIVLLLTHGVTIAFTSAGVLSVVQSGLLWAVAFAFVAMTEEFLCRGYAFFMLASGTNAMFATILLSVLFGSAHGHNDGESYAGLIVAGLFGAVLSFSVWRTGSLWWALGFHAAWDWSESFVFGASDSGQVTSGSWMVSHAAGPAWLSGGTVGPEGSLLVFPALAVLTLVVMLTLPRNPQRWVRRERLFS